MAQLIDTVDNQKQPDDSQDENQQEESQLDLGTPEESTEEVELPDKYRGKSIQDLVQMHQEAEKAIGRQGSEVGELRKVVDNFISSNIKPVAPEEPEDDDTDWFLEPDKALDKKLENHPLIKQLGEDNKKRSRESSMNQLQQKHPDYTDILKESEFADWIRQSKVRTKLFIEADQNFDTDAADELFSNWKERKNLAKATADADKSARSEEIKRASTGGARGSDSPPSKKIYRRADIIELMQKDPKRYAAMASEILLAYKEKRVR